MARPGCASTRRSIDCARSPKARAFSKKSPTPSRFPSDVIVILQKGADLDRLLDDNAAFVAAARSAIPSLSLQAPAALLPSTRTQQARAQLVRAGMPPMDRLRADLERAATDAGFLPRAFDPFIERLGRIAAAEPLTLRGVFRPPARRRDQPVRRARRRRPGCWRPTRFRRPVEERAALRGRRRCRGDGLVMTGMALVNEELSDAFPSRVSQGPRARHRDRLCADPRDVPQLATGAAGARAHGDWPGVGGRHSRICSTSSSICLPSSR